MIGSSRALLLVTGSTSCSISSFLASEGTCASERVPSDAHVFVCWLPCHLLCVVRPCCHVCVCQWGGHDGACGTRSEQHKRRPPAEPKQPGGSSLGISRSFEPSPGNCFALACVSRVVTDTVRSLSLSNRMRLASLFLLNIFPRITRQHQPSQRPRL